LFKSLCRRPILDHYKADLLHPPNGECKAKTYTGYHKILFVKAGYNPVVISEVAGRWQVGEGSETTWSLAAVSGGDKSISAANGI